MNSSKELFWNYSLSLYSRPEISELCLKLQNMYGAEVNLLLLCLWFAETKSLSLPKPVINAILQQVAPCREEIVAPLRDVRRRLAKMDLIGVEAADIRKCRDDVKSAELKAEKLVQHAMLAAVDQDKLVQHRSGRFAATFSFEAVSQLLPVPGSHETLCHLLESAFSSTPPKESSGRST